MRTQAASHAPVFHQVPQEPTARWPSISSFWGHCSASQSVDKQYLEMSWLNSLQNMGIRLPTSQCPSLFQLHTSAWLPTLLLARQPSESCSSR